MMFNPLNIQLLNRVKAYHSIVIFGHTSPDGDCFSCQSSLKQFIKENFPDKEVYVTGSGFSKALPYFGEMDIVSDEIISNSLGIVVDVSDLERIEDQRVVNCKEIVKFDHHINSDRKGFASVNIADISSGSCAEVIGKFILDNGYEISKDVGERLYLGITTDTGRFLYLNKDADSFIIADKILKSGADLKKIYNFLYESDVISARAKGYIGYNFMVKEGVAYIVLNKEVLNKLGIDYNYASTMVNVMSNLKGVESWVSFAENVDGEVRVELRSSHLNVQKVAVKFGGGGHENAAGCKLKDINKYIDVVDCLIEEIKNV